MTKSTQTSDGPCIFRLIRAAVFTGIQMFIGVQIAIVPPNLLCGQAALESQDLMETVGLAGDTHHVQGLEIDGSEIWVTSVDTEGKRGLLLRYQLPVKEPKQAMEIHNGSQYHPGGISSDGTSLWIPVADYKRSSTTTIQRRNKQTLEIEQQFEVSDHIGAIAVTPEGLLGANWDARDFYAWDKQGRLLRKFANPYPVAVQDMKFVAGRLVVAGLLADRSGVVDWLEWPSLKLVAGSRQAARIGESRTQTRA